MNTTTILKYLSLVMGLLGIIASMSVIPGVSQTESVTIIGAAASLYKVCDIIENWLAKQTTPQGAQAVPVAAPSSSVKYPPV